jgi:hypothetical protein
VNGQQRTVRERRNQPRGDAHHRVQTPAHRALAERRQQRLPDRVEDQTVLARVALLLGTRRD